MKKTVLNGRHICEDQFFQGNGLVVTGDMQLLLPGVRWLKARGWEEGVEVVWRWLSRGGKVTEGTGKEGWGRMGEEREEGKRERE